mmetsp:Transcript_66572/g.118319  ORF Transcript_66572/g.118319 Transcript_66572/m.118319 type:complete len:170 (+) Transcript_66572:3-512(+)
MGWEQDPNTGLWWDGADGPYDGKWNKLPYKADELVSAAKALTLRAETAGLITIPSDGLPRCRTVTVGRHVADDFAEVTVATRGHTRKCEEISANSNVTIFWQEKDGMGGWVSAAGTASVAPGEGDKAKVCLKVRRLEMQDYSANITGNGTDCWKPVVLERQDESWTKIQ